MTTIPDEERVMPGGPPASKREAIDAAYLRAAHAYMLISMPTGTSTIFGVFQAILALLVNGTTSALPIKLVGNENFASEIFCQRSLFLCCIAKGAHAILRLAVKPKMDQQVQTGGAIRMLPRFDFIQANDRIKNL